MRLAGFSLALVVALVFAGAAEAAKQPKHRPPGYTIWFTPSPEIKRATVMIDEGQVREGMEIIRFEMRRNLHPGDVIAGRNSLCVGYLMLKEFRKAVKECRRVIRLRPSMWQGHNNLGNARFGLKDYRRAIRSYERALELEPETEDIRSNLALAKRYLAEEKAH